MNQIIKKFEIFKINEEFNFNPFKRQPDELYMALINQLDKTEKYLKIVSLDNTFENFDIFINSANKCMNYLEKSSNKVKLIKPVILDRRYESLIDRFFDIIMNITSAKGHYIVPMKELAERFNKLAIKLDYNRIIQLNNIK
jgi:hypothetical protein